MNIIEPKQRVSRTRGWFSYGCDKLILNLDRAAEIFKSTHVTSSDIIEYINYVEPKADQTLIVFINDIANGMEIMENAIVSGRFGKSAIATQFTSNIMRVFKTSVHDMDQLGIMVHYLKEYLILFYLSSLPGVSQNYIYPKKPSVVYKQESAKVTDKEQLTKIIENIRPYLVILESYQTSIMVLLAQTVTALNILNEKLLK